MNPVDRLSNALDTMALAGGNAGLSNALDKRFRSGAPPGSGAEAPRHEGPVHPALRRFGDPNNRWEVRMPHK